MNLKKVTSLNLLVKQQYQCQECNYIGKYDYSHLQIHGKLIKKPWKTKSRPLICEKCDNLLEYGKGQGVDAWVDDWSGVYRFWLLVGAIFLGASFYVARVYDIQVFEEIAYWIFGDKYTIND